VADPILIALSSPFVPAKGFLCERGICVIDAPNWWLQWSAKEADPHVLAQRLCTLENGGSAKVVDGGEGEDISGDIG
jgi:hypothetical protein